MEQESNTTETTNESSSSGTQEITSQPQALGILLNAIEVAQRRGAFNLDEAELLSRARKLFIKQDTSTTAPEVNESE